MALSWAQSKVERFQEQTTGSSIGPGDYDPCIPKSQGMAGAVSLGFTSTKGMKPIEREEEGQREKAEAVLSSARDRLASAASRRTSLGGPRPPVTAAVGASRLDKVKAEQQAKQLAWAETEREKLEAEVKTLKTLQVRRGGAAVCGLDSAGENMPRGEEHKKGQGWRLGGAEEERGRK